MKNLQTQATEQLWRAVRAFVTATVADPSTEARFLARLAEAGEVGVMIEIQPQPRIAIAGTDAHGRFAQTFELRASHGELN